MAQRTKKSAAKSKPRSRPSQTPRPGRPGVSGTVFDEVEKWSSLGAGAVGLAAGYTGQVLKEQHGERDRGHKPLLVADVIKVLPGAMVGLSQFVQGKVFDAIAATELKFHAMAEAASAIPITSRSLEAAYGWLSEWDTKFAESQRERNDRAVEFLARVAPETATALLTRVDMNVILADVDIDALVEKVTVEKVIDKVDVNALMADVITDLDAAGLLREGTGAIAGTAVGSLQNTVGAATRMAGKVVRRP